MAPLKSYSIPTWDVVRGIDSKFKGNKNINFFFFFLTKFTLVESMIFRDATEAVNRNGNTGNRKRNTAGHFDFLHK